ncbi:hypothetical protein [Shewanella aegiceratis]|uniref:hypothetical protein n=1 Tax=Shewanella aegiceratis TaxID=2864203 RepID=UPI001C66127E|nr:hypothetical protein [Shewanella aegiceratis]QYJ81283.1 hypothetical protein K0H80_13265 [Shewanella aegiceratis]
MSVDYSKCTLDELLDVNDNIDKEQYPDRYQQLTDEIKRRRAAGEVASSRQGPPDWLYDDEDDVFIEFASDGPKGSRYLFIFLFFMVNLIFLAYVLPKYHVAELADVHEYSTTIDAIQCRSSEVIDEETGGTFYDLEITSFQDNFYAVNIGASKCHRLAQSLKVGEKIAIWHEAGLILQLKAANKTLLPYKYMKPKVRQFQTSYLIYFWFGLLIFWGGLFKSLVNALVPGTFKAREDVPEVSR